MLCRMVFAGTIGAHGQEAVSAQLPCAFQPVLDSSGEETTAARLSPSILPSGLVFYRAIFLLREGGWGCMLQVSV